MYRKYVSIILLGRRPSCTSRCAVWWIVVSMWIELRRRRLLVDQWIECCRSMDRMSSIDGSNGALGDLRRSNGSNFSSIGGSMSTRQLDRVFEDESMDSEWIALILLQPAGGGPCGRNHMLG